MLLTGPRFCGLFGDEFASVPSQCVREQLPLEPREIPRGRRVPGVGVPLGVPLNTALPSTLLSLTCCVAESPEVLSSSPSRSGSSLRPSRLCTAL